GVVGDRGAVRGRCGPGQRDAGAGGGGGVEGRGAGRAGGDGRAFARHAAFADGVERADLVVVGGAVADGAVGPAGDVAEGGEEALAAARGAAVYPVAGDRRAAVRARRRPGQTHGAVPAHNRSDRRPAGHGGGCGRGGGEFAGEAAFADAVQGADLVVVGGAVGEAAVGVAGEVADRGQERFGSAGGGAVDAVVG